MKEQIADLVTKLSDVHDQIGQYDGLKERISQMQAVLSATETQLKTSRAELADVNIRLSKEKAATAKRLEDDLAAKQRELRDVLAMVETAKSELLVIQTDTVKAQKKFEELNRSIQKLERAVA